MTEYGFKNLGIKLYRVTDMKNNIVSEYLDKRYDN